MKREKNEFVIKSEHKREVYTLKRERKRQR